MMGFFRFLAIVFLGVALLLLGADIVTSLESGDVVMRGLTEALQLVGADPTEWLERTLPSAVAGIIETVMSWPAWATVGVFGLVIGALSWGRPDEEYDSDTIRD